jgi:hypothetical protein
MSVIPLAAGYRYRRFAVGHAETPIIVRKTKKTIPPAGPSARQVAPVRPRSRNRGMIEISPEQMRLLHALARQRGKGMTTSTIVQPRCGISNP